MTNDPVLPRNPRAEETGGWTVLFPDLPGCATHGATVQEEQWMAAEAADLHLAVTAMRTCRSCLRAASRRASRCRWAKGRGLDWSRVVISLTEVDGAN